MDSEDGSLNVLLQNVKEVSGCAILLEDGVTTSLNVRKSVIFQHV